MERGNGKRKQCGLTGRGDIITSQMFAVVQVKNADRLELITRQSLTAMVDSVKHLLSLVTTGQ